jgi:hypothetical protein
MCLALAVLPAKELATEKQDTSAPGNPSYTVLILPFEDTSGSDYGSQLAEALAKQLKGALLRTSNLTPKLARADDVPDPSQVDLPTGVRLGRASRSEMALIGTLLSAEVQDKENSFNGPSLGGVSVSGSSHSQDASVILQVDVIDVGRGRKLASLRATGKDHEGKISPSVSTDYGSMDMGGGDFLRTALGKATESAVNDLAGQLVTTARGFTPTATPVPVAAAGPATEPEAPPDPGVETPAVSPAPAGPPAEPGGAACIVYFRVVLAQTQDPFKSYHVSVGDEDRSSQLTDGNLEIDNPPAQIALKVRVSGGPPGLKLQPEYSGQVDYKCDRPQKELVLEIDKQGNGKFNWF